MVKACRLLVVAGWIGLGVVLAGATVVRGQTCLDPGRTIFVSGGPGTEGCHTYDSNPTSCGLAFISGGSGPTSCYYDNNAASCNGCGPKNQRAGLCVNACFQVAAAPTVSHTMLLVIGVLLSFAGVRMLRTRTMQRSRS